PRARARRHRDGGGRRGAVPQVQGALVLAADDAPPAAGVEVLLGARPQVGARAVGDPHPRRGVGPAAGLPDAVVHLPVLGADERLVVAADPLERAAPERPEAAGLALA